MTAPDTRVGISVDWGESGSGVIGRATQELNNLEHAGSNAGLSLGDRLGTAFQRLEAREPTMVLRRARFAIEELGASALGATGPMGRLASSLALLVPGGALTLGAVAGFGAIALEIKALVEQADHLDQAMQRANASFAATIGGSAGIFTKLSEARQTVEDLSQPGFWEKFLQTTGMTVGIMTGGLLQPGKEAGEAAGIGRGAQRTTAQLRADAIQAQIDEDRTNKRLEHEEQLRRASEQAGTAIANARIELEKISYASYASKLQLHDWNVEQDLLRIRTMNVRDAHGQLIPALVQERDTLYQLHWQMGLLGRMAILGESPEAARLLQRPVGAGGLAGFEAATRLGTSTSVLRGGIPLPIAAPGGPSVEEMVQRMNRGQPITTPEEQRAMLLAVIHESDTRLAEQQDKSPNRLAISMIGASISAIGDIARQGPAGAIGGVGGILSTLSSKIPALGVPGAILGGLSGLFGLFGRHPQHMTIDGFTERALEDLKRLREIPTNVSVNVAAANPNELRQTRYALGRADRTGLVTTLPYG